jgi:hypothetical protein
MTRNYHESEEDVRMLPTHDSKKETDMDVDCSDEEVESDFDITLQTPHRPTDNAFYSSPASFSASPSPSARSYTRAKTHIIYSPPTLRHSDTRTADAGGSSLVDHMASPVFSAPVKRRLPISGNTAPSMRSSAVAESQNYDYKAKRTSAPDSEVPLGSFGVESLASPARVPQAHHRANKRPRSRSPPPTDRQKASHSTKQSSSGALASGVGSTGRHHGRQNAASTAASLPVPRQKGSVVVDHRPRHIDHAAKPPAKRRRVDGVPVPAPARRGGIRGSLLPRSGDHSTITRSGLRSSTRIAVSQLSADGSAIDPAAPSEIAGAKINRRVPGKVGKSDAKALLSSRDSRITIDSRRSLHGGDAATRGNARAGRV